MVLFHCAYNLPCSFMNAYNITKAKLDKKSWLGFIVARLSINVVKIFNSHYFTV